MENQIEIITEHWYYGYCPDCNWKSGCYPAEGDVQAAITFHKQKSHMHKYVVLTSPDWEHMYTFTAESMEHAAQLYAEKTKDKKPVKVALIQSEGELVFHTSFHYFSGE